MATSKTLSLPSLEMLSSVRDLRALERLEPARFTAALAAELSASDDSLATLTAQLDGLHEALLAIEEFSRRAMDLRLTFVLAHEPVPPQLRRLISATVVTYEDDLALMEKRFERYLPIAVLDKILIAAQQVLALRLALRNSVLQFAQQVARSGAASLHKAARRPLLEEPERRRLRLARLDLQQLAEQPERLATARCEARIKKLVLPKEEDEISVEDEAEAPQEAPAQRFSLLEID